MRHPSVYPLNNADARRPSEAGRMGDEDGKRERQRQRGIDRPCVRLASSFPSRRPQQCHSRVDLLTSDPPRCRGLSGTSLRQLPPATWKANEPGVRARVTMTRGPSLEAAVVLPTATVTVVSQLANRKACHCRLSPSVRPTDRPVPARRRALLLAERCGKWQGTEGSGRHAGHRGAGLGLGHPSRLNAEPLRNIPGSSARVVSERPPREWDRAVRVKPDSGCRVPLSDETLCRSVEGSYIAGRLTADWKTESALCYAGIAAQDAAAVAAAARTAIKPS